MAERVSACYAGGALAPAEKSAGDYRGYRTRELALPNAQDAHITHAQPTTMAKHVLVGAGNPLLDISSNVPQDLLEK